MKKQDITVDFAAPIPLGHKVEVVQFKKKDKILIGPWIKDIDTGIEYGMDFHYEDRGFLHFDKLTVWPVDIRSDIDVDKKITGTITRCRVLTMRLNLDWLMQTRLQIEENL